MSPSRWSAYRPSASAPWDLARAWTLRRRAGFAATWDELRCPSGPWWSAESELAVAPVTKREERFTATWALDLVYRLGLSPRRRPAAPLARDEW